MKTTKLNYHLGLNKTSVYRTVVAVIFFTIIINILNLGAFYKGSSVTLNASVLQAETELGRIYSKINLPIKIVEDLFKGEKGVSGAKESDSRNNNYYALLPNQSLRSIEVQKKVSYIPINEINMTARSFSAASSPGVFDELCSNTFIRTLILILMLMSVLPRGIPVRIKNLKNINFAFPDFIFNKAGFFCFYENANGGHNENN